MSTAYSTTADDKPIQGKAILLHLKDDVATALTRLESGETVTVSLEDRTETVVLAEAIDFGHKFALHSLAAGEKVLKYGLPIGKALGAIREGEWVHVHNCRSEHFASHHQEVISNRDLTQARLMEEKT